MSTNRWVQDKGCVVKSSWDKKKLQLKAFFGQRMPPCLHERTVAADVHASQILFLAEMQSVFRVICSLIFCILCTCMHACTHTHTHTHTFQTGSLVVSKAGFVSSFDVEKSFCLQSSCPWSLYNVQGAFVCKGSYLPPIHFPSSMIGQVSQIHKLRKVFIARWPFERSWTMHCAIVSLQRAFGKFSLAGDHLQIASVTGKVSQIHELRKIHC